MSLERALFIVWLGFRPAGLLAGVDAEADFNKAYYLEKEKGDLEDAGRLYQEVMKSPAASPELVKRAEKRLAALRMRLRSGELARLVPDDVLAYIEIRKPAEHLANLLKLAGFLAPEEPSGGAAAGQPAVAVSPRLLKAIQEIDGAALAITEVDLQGPPRGVLIVNCGRSDLAQGLIETALSGAAASKALRPAEAVEGYPAYEGPFGVLVTTGELAIAANPRELAVEAMRRLRQEGLPSLNEVPAFAELKTRKQGSFAFGFVNGQRALELSRKAMVRGGKLPKEYLILQALADVESLEWLGLDLGTCEEGLAAKLSLRLRDGNHCLPYHLLRTPRLGREALRAVPPGSALALGLGLGQPASSGSQEASQAASALTGLDLGREIFSNVNAVLAYVMPEEAAVQPEGLPGPIPDAGIVFLVKDSSRSEALWKELLRISSTLLRIDPQSVREEELEGVKAEVYGFPNSFQIFLATLPGRLVLATSKTALAASLKAAKGGDSILEDMSLARPLQELDPEASKVIAAHGGRVFKLAQMWMRMPAEEAALVSALLERATLSFSSRETPTRLDVNLVISAPGVGPVIQQLLSKESNQSRSPRRAESKLPKKAEKREHKTE